MNKKTFFVMILTAIIVISAISFFIIFTGSSENYEKELEEIKLLIREDLKEFNMIKRIRNNKGENRGILEPEVNFTKPERLSHYQGFVTPNIAAVSNYVNDEKINNIEDAYNTAVSWTWVSDSTMHNKLEWWLKPKAFIEDTPNKTLYPNNPVNGMASDCESHAYTLVSLIENIGFPKQNVRVVIGEVIFSGQKSGHAWVQVYENGNWYELESTSGPYWDDDTNTLVNSPGADINYFKTRPYPVEKYIAFFNDIYYYNPSSGIKSENLPNHWFTTERHFSLAELKSLKQKQILQRP